MSAQHCSGGRGGLRCPVGGWCVLVRCLENEDTGRRKSKGETWRVVGFVGVMRRVI